MARDDYGRGEWNDRGGQRRDQYEPDANRGGGRGDPERGRYGSPRSDERDAGYGGMGVDGEGRDERVDYSGRGGIGGGMGAEGGGRYAGRPEDDARAMRYDRSDYEGGSSRRGLEGGRGLGGGRDASFDRDDARHDAYGASGNRGGTGNQGMQRSLQSGDTLGRAREQFDQRDTQYGGRYAHEYGREGDYGRAGGGMSGRPGGSDMMDRNPGQGFGGFGYSNADERGDRYDRASGGTSGGMARDASTIPGGLSPRGDTSRASYAGRGPRNYQRGDERIRDDVCERLTRHHDIDASDVDIEVRDGVVTLSGQVEDKQMKRLAEDVAEEVMGVREVRNELRTARGGLLGRLFGGDASHDREVSRDATREGGMGASSSTPSPGTAGGRSATGSTGAGGTGTNAGATGGTRRGRTE